MAVININNDNFQNEVMNSKKKILPDFGTPWCQPCRMLFPMVEESAKKRPDIKDGNRAMGARSRNEILGML